MQQDQDDEIPCVGKTDDPEARRLRIVHISDTHHYHDEMLPLIPNGDILIHSGDFSQLSLRQFLVPGWDYRNELDIMSTFFSKLPHRYKIFVAGNHELNFMHHSAEHTQSLLKNAIYLQDSSVVIEGIKIYGSPWNGKRRSRARGFTVPYPELHSYWKQIPDDTDILVTHNPPQSILDFGSHRPNPSHKCSICGDNTHSRHSHLGCPFLGEEVLNRVRYIPFP